MRTNLVWPETRQVSYKFLLQKRLSLFYRRHSTWKTRRTEVNHFSLYHRSTRQTKSDSLSARTRKTFISMAQFPFTVSSPPGLMITYVIMRTPSFVLGASPRGDCLNSSSEELSYWSVAGFSGDLLVSQDAGSISSSLSNDSRLLPPANRVFEGRAEILHMAQGSIDWYGLLIDDTSDLSLFEVGGTLAIERLYPDRISSSVCSVHFSSTGWALAVDSFDSNPEAVDSIGRCTCKWHIVLWCRIISVHGFRDFILLSDGDPFYTSMTPLRYTFATWHMRAS